MTGASGGSTGVLRRVVDIHAHALPAEFVQTLRQLAPVVGSEVIDGGESVSLDLAGRRVGPLPLSLVDLDARLRAMDDGGITVHVLSSPPFAFLYDLDPAVAAESCAAFNESIIRWAERWPERFRVLASLPMQNAEDALRELERLQRHPSVAGVAIGSNISGKNLDLPEFAPVLAALAEADLPVLIHPNNGASKRLSRYFLRNLVGNPVDTTIAGAALIYGGVLERLPGLRVCLVHGGGFLPYQLGRLVHGFDRVPNSRRKLSRSPREFLSQLFFDTVLHDPRALRFMGEQVGWSQVLVGSDFPFDMGDSDPRATLRSLGLSEEDLHNVASSNATRFLRHAVAPGSVEVPFKRQNGW